MAAEIDVTFLTEHERDSILSVLHRDERLKEREEIRLRCLKEELRKLRLMGVIRAGDASKSCARCRGSFSWSESGDVCSSCFHKVCDNCKRSLKKDLWICVYCYKQREVGAQSGEWFFSQYRNEGSQETFRTATGKRLTGAELVRLSIYSSRPSSALSSQAVNGQEQQESTGGAGEAKISRQRTSSGVSSHSRGSSVGRSSINSETVGAELEVRGMNSMGERGSLYNSESDAGHASPVSQASMPSISVTMATDELIAGSGRRGEGRKSENEGGEQEDIGEIFASYAGGATNSHAGGKTNSTSAADNSPSSSQLSPTITQRMSRFSAGSKESIVSCYSDAGEEHVGKFPITGEIQFGLNYNYKQCILEIDVKQCKDLAAVDQKKNSSDPYVKTYLLPDKTKNGKRKTKGKRHTLCPVFDEVLKYRVTKSELESRTLCVMVWNNDRFGRNDFLGEVTIPLSYNSFENSSPCWYKLKARCHKLKTSRKHYLRKDVVTKNSDEISKLTYKGDLNICLKFVTEEHISGKRRGSDCSGELQVIVKEARNLTAIRANGFSDPFCKGCLLPERSRRAQLKTPVIKRNCNPRWNHTFRFEGVTWEELKERSLELTVWDHDLLTSNDFLGGVRLNTGTGRSKGEVVNWMDSTSEESLLWQAMLDRPNCWIDGTLLLRVNMNERK